MRCSPLPNLPVSWKLHTCCGRHATHGVSNRHYAGRSEGGPSPPALGQRDPKRVAVFQPEFLEDLRFWVITERNTAIRVLDLVEAVTRDPFAGLGRPEPLRYVLAGCWVAPCESGTSLGVPRGGRSH